MPGMTLSKTNGKGIIKFSGTADRMSARALLKKAVFHARTQRLRSVETYLRPEQTEEMQLFLDNGFMLKRLIWEKRGEGILIMSRQLDHSEPACFKISELPRAEEVMEIVQEGLGMRIEDLSEKPLLLILINEKGRPGISMRAVATYAGFIEERNLELGSPFDVEILDLKTISDPALSARIAERIRGSNGVIFNRARTSILPEEIVDLLDRHGINSLKFDRATEDMASLLEKVQEDPELDEYIPQAKYHINKEAIPAVLRELLKQNGTVLIIDEDSYLAEPVEVRRDMSEQMVASIISQLNESSTYMIQWKASPMKTIDGRPFIIDAVIQRDHLGKFNVSQKIVRIPKKKKESRVHVGVTPGYTGQQTILKELWDDGTISEELIKRIDSVLGKLAKYLEECYGSVGNLGCKILISEDEKIYITFITDRPFQAPVGITPIIQGRIEQTKRLVDQALWRFVKSKNRE
jgi:hypothetical protein